MIAVPFITCALEELQMMGWNHHPLHLICRWFDLVIVLQTDNTLLYERLEKR